MMLVSQNIYKSVFFLFMLVSVPTFTYGDHHPRSPSNDTSPEFNENAEPFDLLDPSRRKKSKRLTYYLYVSDFVNSFIEIPTATVSGDSSTISSRYLAGRAPIYNTNDEKVGVCSASFLCMQNAQDIFTDIANYLSVDNGLIVTWFTPTTLINLELDTIVHSMVTECIVVASTKVGFNPFYGKKFNMVVSSDDQKIYFKLHKI
jgi:hypothetical protein